MCTTPLGVMVKYSISRLIRSCGSTAFSAGIVGLWVCEDQAVLDDVDGFNLYLKMISLRGINHLNVEVKQINISEITRRIESNGHHMTISGS